MLFLSGIFLIGCGSDDGDDGGGGDPIPATAAEVVKLFSGEGKDSTVWLGSKWYQADWDPFTLDYSTKENDLTDKPGINFTDHVIWFKYDDYFSEEVFFFPVGKARWTDPLGKSNHNWEMDNDINYQLNLNVNEDLPPRGGRQQWTFITVTEDKLEFTREYLYSGAKKKDRFVWTKK